MFCDDNCTYCKEFINKYGSYLVVTHVLPKLNQSNVYNVRKTHFLAYCGNNCLYKAIRTNYAKEILTDLDKECEGADNG